MPQPPDKFLLASNVRARDGKDVNHLAPASETVLFRRNRAMFVEDLTTTERADVIDFFCLD